MIIKWLLLFVDHGLNALKRKSNELNSVENKKTNNFSFDLTL